MAEPNTTTFFVTGVVAAALGPVLGPISLIAFGAISGSLLALTKTKTSSTWEAVWFVTVGVLLALCLAGGAAWVIERYLDIPGFVVLMPVSVVIGAGRNYLVPLIEQGAGALGALLSRRGG